VTIDRLPKEIRDALRKLEPKLRRAFLDAIGDIRKAVDPSAIARLIEAGDIEAAIKAMRFEPSLFGPIDRTLEEAYRDAGIAALAALPVIRDPNLGGRFVIGFDGRHPRAELWARQMSSRLITEIVDDQRNMAREQIQAGVTAGRSPITTALDIVGRINKATGQREGGRRKSKAAVMTGRDASTPASLPITSHPITSALFRIFWPASVTSGDKMPVVASSALANRVWAFLTAAGIVPPNVGHNPAFQRKACM